MLIHICCSAPLTCKVLQASADIDWKSYEKEVDPQVLKAFRDSFSSECLRFHPVTALLNLFVVACAACAHVSHPALLTAPSVECSS